MRPEILKIINAFRDCKYEQITGRLCRFDDETGQWGVSATGVVAMSYGSDLYVDPDSGIACLTEANGDARDLFPKHEWITDSGFSCPMYFTAELIKALPELNLLPGWHNLPYLNDGPRRRQFDFRRLTFSQIADVIEAWERLGIRHQPPGSLEYEKQM